MLIGNRHQPVHVHRAAKEVHRHQGAGGRADRCTDLVEINQIGGGINIHKHRGCPHRTDGLSGGKKTERAGDHLITRPNAQAPQGQDQGIGAAVAANGVGAAAEAGKRSLKFLNHRTTDVAAAAQHLQHRLVQVVP